MLVLRAYSTWAGGDRTLTDMEDHGRPLELTFIFSMLQRATMLAFRAYSTWAGGTGL